MTTPTITLITVTSHTTITGDAHGGARITEGWRVQPAEVNLDEDSTYDFLKSIIPDTMQVIETHEKVDVWYDDNGRYNGSTINPIASVIIGAEMRGPVVLARHNAAGATTGFTPEEVATILDKLGRVADALGEAV